MGFRGPVPLDERASGLKHFYVARRISECSSVDHIRSAHGDAENIYISRGRRGRRTGTTGRRKCKVGVPIALAVGHHVGAENLDQSVVQQCI
jgi:hypothetical protein